MAFNSFVHEYENNISKKDDDGEWDSWTSNNVASILVDGQKINDIFSSIRKQLEYLRRKQKALEKAQEEMMDVGTELEPPPPQPVVVREEEKPEVKPEEVIETKTRAVAGQFLRSSFAAAFATKDDITALRADMEALKQQQEQKDAFEQRFRSLEMMMQSEMKDIQKKMDKLSLQMNQINLDTMEQKDKLFTLEQNLNAVVKKQADDFDSKLELIEIAQNRLQKDHELKLSSLKDIVSIQELKSKQTELKVNNALGGLHELQQHFDSLSEKYFDAIHSSIHELQEDKAGRIELESKADITQVLTKVEQSSFQELQEFTEELERRVSSLHTDTNDRLVNLDGKLDRRSDRIVSWCLKQLRKELKNLLANPNGGDEHGTDIGKVQIRCLVCDQVTTQQRETEIVHSQQNGFVQTIRGFQRPARSHSPSAGSPEHEGGSPNRQYHTNTNTNTNTNAKIMVMSPGGQHPDEVDEFADRTGHHQTAAVSLESRGNQHTVTVPTAPFQQQGSQSMPLLKILSKSHPDGSTITPTNQTKIISYYKDMEQKYGSTFHPGTGSNRNAMPGNKLSKNRPTSAPIKRSSSQAKLRPMNVGKVILTDE